MTRKRPPQSVRRLDEAQREDREREALRRVQQEIKRREDASEGDH